MFFHNNNFVCKSKHLLCKLEKEFIRIEIGLFIFCGFVWRFFNILFLCDFIRMIIYAAWLPFMLCNLAHISLSSGIYLFVCFLVYINLTLACSIEHWKKKSKQTWVWNKVKNKSTFYNCNAPKSFLPNECSAAEMIMNIGFITEETMILSLIFVCARVFFQFRTSNTTLTLLSSFLLVWFQAGLDSILSRIHSFWRAFVNACRLSNTAIYTKTQLVIIECKNGRFTAKN